MYFQANTPFCLEDLTAVVSQSCSRRTDIHSSWWGGLSGREVEVFGCLYYIYYIYINTVWSIHVEGFPFYLYSGIIVHCAGIIIAE